MNQFAMLTASLSALTFGGAWLASDPTPPAKAAAPATRETRYAGCDAVRAAGKAPLYAHQPGYRPDMDGDGDGIACEPHRANAGGDGHGGRAGRRRR